MKSPASISILIKGYLVSIPILCLGVFYLFVIRTRISIGSWPVAHNPDPKSLEFEFHYLSIYLFLSFTMISVPVLVYWFVFHSKPMVKNKSRIISVSLSWMIFSILLFLDPFNFFDWFFD